MVGTLLGTMRMNPYIYDIISDEYYRFEMTIDGNLWGMVYYADDSCSGTPYLFYPQTVVRIVDTGGVDKYYYSPKKGNSLQFPPKSYKHSSNEDCNVFGGAPTGLYFEGMLNDFGITGVRSESVGSGYYIGGRK